MAETSPSNETVREEILKSIRAANRGATNLEDARTAWSAIERDYRSHGQLDAAATLRLFEERLVEYGAGVHHATADTVAAIVRQALNGRGIQRAVVPSGLPSAWLPETIEFVRDGIAGDHLTLSQLDGFPAVITSATLGIAETGTIVLQALPEQGRRAITLIPDYHLCILRTSSIVETVVEATRQLQSTATLPTTWFSGPSATADIEMTRIKGVHGPRFLDVVLLDL